MATNPAVSVAKRKRLRAVEELMISGLGATEIHEILEPRFSVTYGTIRNDIVTVRKVHRSDFDSMTELRGREDYLAAVRQVRRKAITGWTETDAQGATRIKGRDYRLVHNIDKEIASLAGVRLTAGDKTITLNMERAREYLQVIFNIVFKHVVDEDTRKLILTDIELIEEKPSE